MTDEELLKATEAVLRDAIEEAEFSRLPKDVAYAEMVANKVEGLRAKMGGFRAGTVRCALVRGRVMLELTMAEPIGFFREARG